MADIPFYIYTLLDKLHSEYSEVDYYLETDNEYTLTDCFICDRICIKVDRLPLDNLSHHDMTLLFDSIVALRNEIIDKYGDYLNVSQ